MNIDWSTIGALTAAGVALFALAAFLIKALIYKTTAPLDKRVKQLENSMLLSEESQTAIKNIQTLVEGMSDNIDSKIEKREKLREELYRLTYVTKEEFAAQ